jgi:branched-chain amino acid aminotransferase
MMKITVTHTKKSRLPEVDYSNLGFGKFFSDHMFSMDYSDGEWKSPRILPYGALDMLPATAALHYGQVVFDGLKAFRRRDGGINLFRPEKYLRRMNASSRRLCIPEIDEGFCLAAMEKLVRLDAAWVPEKRDCALYIRPFTYAADPYLGVKVSDTYRFMMIASPVGAYFSGGKVNLTTMPKYVRAFPGGLGAAKTPANYAASLLPAEEARKRGFTQVLWLDGIERKYIEEVGAMNIFFLIGDTLVTPALEGTILAGVTRDSTIELARSMGMKVEERKIGIDEVIAASDAGTLNEVFGSGTAAVISPVDEITHGERTIRIKKGGVAKRLYDEITRIQYGEKEDKFGWCRRIE